MRNGLESGKFYLVSGNKVGFNVNGRNGRNCGTDMELKVKMVETK